MPKIVIGSAAALSALLLPCILLAEQPPDDAKVVAPGTTAQTRVLAAPPGDFASAAGAASARGAELVAELPGKGTPAPSVGNGKADGPPPSTPPNNPASAAADPTIAVTQVSVRPMSNQDVMALKAAGISDDLVIAKIKSSAGTYNLAADDIIALKQANVSDAVIQTMLSAEAPETPSAAPAESNEPASPDAPKKGLLRKLKVALLGSPDVWSLKTPAHPEPPPDPPPLPPQLTLCPVTILSQPADAAILVDGYPAGRTPSVIKLMPGSYKVTLQAQGYPAYTQQIVVEAGQVRSFGVALDAAR